MGDHASFFRQRHPHYLSNQWPPICGNRGRRGKRSEVTLGRGLRSVRAREFAMNRRDFSRAIAASLFLPRVAGAISDSLVQPATHPTPALREFEKPQFGVSFHFSMNTFTGNDYEAGAVPATTYNPTKLDVRQWIRAARGFGAKYAVLTAKHMSGFCLWDSANYD